MDIVTETQGNVEQSGYNRRRRGGDRHGVGCDARSRGLSLASIRPTGQRWRPACRRTTEWVDIYIIAQIHATTHMGPRQFDVGGEYLFLGRTFAEYRRFFSLSPPSLAHLTVLDCPGGPSAFAATASQLGCDVRALSIRCTDRPQRPSNLRVSPQSRRSANSCKR